jgi:protein involved in polysaccharide export with SLBB domain
MKKISIYFFLSLLFVTAAFGQMSDGQVVDYVKQEHAKGTPQQVIATSLMKKGVTKDQLERIKKQEEQKQLSSTSSTKSSEQLRRERRTDPEMNLTDSKLDEISDGIGTSTLKDSTESEVFGRNIFNANNLTFNPSVNIPTPIDYRLGPGDEVIIDVWGASQTSVRETISPEGSITIDRLGPVYLNGMTVKEANEYIQRKFASIYSGINGNDGVSQVKLTLGQIRTIQINVMGEVVAPGTYSLSSLSSVFHALYRAGGVNSIGSLRTVKLYRNGKLLRTLDIYKFILEGKMNDDIRMTDGDVVIVPPYVSLVSIVGNVKRPMYYEMATKESISDLINYAGGFKGDAYMKSIRIVRKTGNENKIFTLKDTEFNKFIVNDGDIVTISSGLDLYENRVEIKGAVFREGYYEIGSGVQTIKDLIGAADGIRGDAFLNRAVLTREKDDFTTETQSVNLRSLLYENGEDIVLRKNDILYIPSINDLKEYGDFLVHGEVARPGNYKYAENTTLEDIIIQAGGLLESASTVRVDIARRIIDPYSITVNRTLSENYSFALKDGFVVDGDPGFILKPYDQIYVRKSPGYQEQKNIYLEGEVLFPGTYALNKKTERLSDVIRRAGNITSDAYAKGARLTRQQTVHEKFRDQAVLKIAAQQSKDSISVKSLDLANVYNVGIELDKALNNPGSDYDLVLREGDRIIIPEYDNTVKINGAVMYPNTVVYKKGEKLSYYINQAGGYADNAKKNKSFVIYMNGTVSKVKGSDGSAIQPGAEIIVPTKEQSKRMSLAEIVSMGSSITSMASVVALLINTLSK